LRLDRYLEVIMAIFFSKGFSSFVLDSLFQHLDCSENELDETSLARTLFRNTYQTDKHALAVFTKVLNQVSLEDGEIKEDLKQRARQDLLRFSPSAPCIVDTWKVAKEKLLSALPQSSPYRRVFAERISQLDSDKFRCIRNLEWTNYVRQFDFSNGIISAEEFNERHKALQFLLGAKPYLSPSHEDLNPASSLLTSDDFLER